MHYRIIIKSHLLFNYSRPPVPLLRVYPGWQVKTILSVLIREYKIELVGDFPDVNFEALVVGPKGKCRVRYTKRT